MSTTTSPTPATSTQSSGRRLITALTGLLGSGKGRIGAALIGVGISLALTSLLFWVLGANPLTSFETIYRGAFGSEYGLRQTVLLSGGLALAAIAVALPFRAGVLNVGAEGQMTAGAVAATIVVFTAPGGGLGMVLLALIAAVLGGAVWGGLVGVLKGYLGANEVITGLMLNFVAILVADFVIAGPWADSLAPQTRRFSEDLALPGFIGGDVVGFAVIALVFVGLGWLLLERTGYGFGLRVLGANPDAGKRAGLDARRAAATVLLVGGGVAGLAGALQAITVNHALISTPAQGYGYTGIAVALLAGLRLPLIPLAAVFFAALTVGSNSLPAVTGVSTSAALIVQGVFVLSLLAAGAIRMKGADRP